MITVQETTVWAGNAVNHKYILSDNKQWMYGYIKAGDKYPQLFKKPIGFDIRGRTFQLLLRTRDVQDNVWYIKGSKGDTYTVTKTDEGYTCSCPASTFRRQECKHTQQVKQQNDR